MAELDPSPLSLATHGSSHFVRFYKDDSLLLDEVAPFVHQALAAGGASIVIATAEHLVALRRRLARLQAEAGGSDPGARLVTRDAEQTLSSFMLDDWPDAALFDATVGQLVRELAVHSATIHAFGEMVALLCERGNYSAAVRLEELWNELARRNRFTLFCAYPWSQFPNAAMADTFRHVCALHDHAAHCAAEAPPSHNPEQRLLELEQQALSLSAEVARRRAAESALAQRERELADFVENAAESIHQVGADGTILWANQAELRLLGYRWEEYVGHHIAAFHADAPVIEDILARLKAGDTVRDVPARLRCKDGGIKHVLISSNGHFEDGALRYTRCFTRDATERHQRDEAQAEREALMAELAASSRAKDEFLAMLGHELRNPLSPILTALEVIRRQGGHSVAHDIIGRQLTHLIRLVDDLLDVSRVNTGSIVLKTEALDLAQIIDKAVEMVAPLLDNRQHRFSVDVQGPLPVRGDHVRLVQIIANLLTNAARYTPPGGDIRLAASGDREHVYVSVVDNGIGIAADALPHVFDLFYQDRRDTDRSTGGLGVGLALVNNLVGLHGGGVEARSAGPGQGSEFRLRLPRLT
ncbi:PAS domain S-box protein, partial [Rugamonas sp. FT107W]